MPERAGGRVEITVVRLKESARQRSPPGEGVAREVSTPVNPLLEPLAPEQLMLLQAIYRPFADTGEWPIWQYVDLTLDAAALDAATVLSSLPTVRRSNDPIAARYGLTWTMNSHFYAQPDQQIALTVAGLARLADADQLLATFMATVAYLVDAQRKLTPRPREVVEAAVPSGELIEALLTASIKGQAGPPVEQTISKLYDLFTHEPMLHSAVQRPYDDITTWSMRVPAALRELRGVTTITDYIDYMTAWASPAAAAAPAAVMIGPLDLAHAVGYLDAVWMSRTSKHLFVDLDAASAARLSQDCGSEAEFNSLLSALADVLGQVVTPGRSAPLQRRALEEFRDHLLPRLDTSAAERVREAFQTLITIRQLRASTQHGDARHRAVAAFGAIGLSFPPASWSDTWPRIGWLAKEALDIIREEVHAGLADEASNRPQ